MKVTDIVEVVHDDNIGLSIVGERGVIVGPGENGYTWEVRFEGFFMSFNEYELKVVDA